MAIVVFVINVLKQVSRHGGRKMKEDQRVEKARVILVAARGDRPLFTKTGAIREALNLMGSSLLSREVRGSVKSRQADSLERKLT